jgi:hypothetical protein
LLEPPTRYYSRLVLCRLKIAYINRQKELAGTEGQETMKNTVEQPKPVHVAALLRSSRRGSGPGVYRSTRAATVLIDALFQPTTLPSFTHRHLDFRRCVGIVQTQDEERPSLGSAPSQPSILQLPRGCLRCSSRTKSYV